MLLVNVCGFFNGPTEGGMAAAHHVPFAVSHDSAEVRANHLAKSRRSRAVDAGVNRWRIVVILSLRQSIVRYERTEQREGNNVASKNVVPHTNERIVCKLDF